MKRLLLIPIAALCLIAAGCGSSSPSSVASVATTTASATTSATSATTPSLVAFAGCMRSHGVASFPDPDSTGNIPKVQVVAARKADRAAFDAASTACGHLMPGGSLGSRRTQQQIQTQRADALSFARCMRSHGVSRFPDPNSQGQLSVAMVQAQGIDVHSTQVLHVVQTCLPASHGALTPAKVERALREASG